MKLDAAGQLENKAKVLQSITELYEETGKVPSSVKVAEHCGLNRETVAKYRREIDISQFFPTLRTRTFEILEGIAQKAIKGDAAAAKIWLQFVEGWKEEVKNTSDHKISPEVWSELERLKGMR